jgi:hypothetical protein
MRSQVQVLAGPPLFSQLRALPPPGRFRSLPAWAAVGPRALRAVEPKDSPGAGGPGSRSITTSTHRGHRSVQPGHGRLCRQSCLWQPARSHAAGRRMSTRTPLPSRRAILALNRPVPGWPGGRTWPAASAPPTTTAQSRPTPPLPSTACGGLSADAVGDHADPRLSSRVAARRTDALQEHTGADTADADAGHWTPDMWTPDMWTSHSRTPDTGHWTLDTGHRTPDTGHRTPDIDRGRGQATKARLASGRPRTPRRVDRPLGCQTVFLCGQPMQRTEP